MVLTILAGFRTPRSDMLPICTPFGLFVVGRIMFDVLPLTHVEFYPLDISLE